MTDSAFADTLRGEFLTFLNDYAENRELLRFHYHRMDGASADFDQELVSKGELTPVFFGSALTNFGVETFLEHFLKMTTSPLPRMSDAGEIDPMDDNFSAFVFKIQANMNKAHRDRIALTFISRTLRTSTTGTLWI